jgi:periplasmic protein TonB
LAPLQPAAEPLPKAVPEPALVSDAAETAPDAGAVAVAGDGASTSGEGMGQGVRSSDEPAVGSAPPPPAISPERRQVLLTSYLQEIFRSRIAAHFQYPEEAERLGLEGLVVVRASVLPTGALWSARTLGDCPQRILCGAAERTVRAAAPFPPPPAELGGAISIDVPLSYRLE